MNLYHPKTQLQLEKMLDELHTKVERNICAIANGGCGWFAYYLHLKLKKVGIHTSILAGDSEIEIGKINNLIYKVKNNQVKLTRLNNKIRVVPQHCMVHITDDFIVDGISTMYTESIDFQCYDHLGNMPLENLEVALKFGVWHKNYNTEQNPALRKIINNVVNKYFSVTKLKEIA